MAELELVPEFVPGRCVTADRAAAATGYRPGWRPTARCSFLKHSDTGPSHPRPCLNEPVVVDTQLKIAVAVLEEPLVFVAQLHAPIPEDQTATLVSAQSAQSGSGVLRTHIVFSSKRGRTISRGPQTSGVRESC